MTPNFEKVIRILNESKVDFVVVGGAAIVAHGVARATFDLDVCYKRSPANIQRLCAALKPYAPTLRGAPDGLPFKFDAKTVQRGLNFTLSTSLGSLDFLGEVSGVGSYADVEKASQRGEVDGQPCKILSIDGLLRAKRAAGRKKDQEAILELESLKELREKLGQKDL